MFKVGTNTITRVIRDLARPRGKIKAGRVSGYDWLGFGLITGLGFWMFYCAQIALRETINRRSHPSWLWKGFAGIGFLLVLLARGRSNYHNESDPTPCYLI